MPLTTAQRYERNLAEALGRLDRASEPAAEALALADLCTLLGQRLQGLSASHHYPNHQRAADLIGKASQLLEGAAGVVQGWPYHEPAG
jgi:hypothetical protein